MTFYHVHESVVISMITRYIEHLKIQTTTHRHHNAGFHILDMPDLSGPIVLRVHSPT